MYTRAHTEPNLVKFLLKFLFNKYSQRSRDCSIVLLDSIASTINKFECCIE